MQKTKVDWREIKSRVNSLQESLNRKTALTREEKYALLKNRAKALAAEKEDVNIEHEFIEIVAFRLATEIYGIESAFVQEVHLLKDYTTLPGLPAYIFGIMNLRGQIISIINLKKFFNLPEKGLGEMNRVIIIRNEKMEFGILADFVEGTVLITLDEIMEIPPTVTGTGEKYLKCITKEHIVVFDAARMLNDQDIIVNEIVI